MINSIAELGRFEKTKNPDLTSFDILYETLSLGRANPTNDIAFIYSKSFFKKPVLK